VYAQLCDDDHYEDSGSCRSCASAGVGTLALMLIFISALFGLLGVMIAASSDSVLNVAVLLFIMLQQVNTSSHHISSMYSANVHLNHGGLCTI